MEKSSQYWIDKLSLQKHPEGGYYKEIYRSDGSFDFPKDSTEFIGKRNYATSIYFLLEGNNFSAFHKIKSDEIWHFYQGNCLIIYSLDEKGILKEHKLGCNLEFGESLQLMIPKNTWFAAKLQSEYGFALVGCTVSPGFDFCDFEMAHKTQLLTIYPQHAKVIEMLCIT
jgi:predicted cupin superfamily sugar epimerase